MTVQPRFLGKFELLRRIGVGGSAEVFEAILHGAEGFNKRLALKALLPDFRDDQVVVDMFIDEATIASRLHHPNIVDVYEFGQIEQTYYLAMELIDGWTLRRAQRLLQATNMEFPVSTAAQCVREVCHALEYIHGAAQQIVHRDVSPQNVFISRQGLIKLGDFGIAKAPTRRSRTESGQLKGKLAYLAPEQVTGEEVSPRTDVYAAGLILFELLTGTPYIKGEREVDVFRDAMNPPTRAPSSLRPDAAPLDSVVLHALQKHPTLRYASARLLADDLARYLSTTTDGLSPAELVALLERQDSARQVRPPPRHVSEQPEEASPRTAKAPRQDQAQGARTTRPLPLTDPKTTRPLPVVDQQTPPLLDRPKLTLLEEAGPPRKRWIVPSVSLVIVASAVAVAALWPEPTSRTPSPRLPILAPPDAASAATAPDSTADIAIRHAPTPRVATSATRSRVRRRIKRRRPKRRRPKQPAHRHAPQPAHVTQAPPVLPVPSAETRHRSAELRGQLGALLNAAKTKGLYPGDDARFDRLARQARNDLTPDSLRQLDQFVHAFRADRPFAEEKLARLNRAIKNASLPEDQRQKMGRLSQQIIRAIIEGRYVQASRSMQTAFAKLKALDR